VRVGNLVRDQTKEILHAAHDAMRYTMTVVIVLAMVVSRWPSSRKARHPVHGLGQVCPGVSKCGPRSHHSHLQLHLLVLWQLQQPEPLQPPLPRLPFSALAWRFAANVCVGCTWRRWILQVDMLAVVSARVSCETAFAWLLAWHVRVLSGQLIAHEVC
jgi:hypothetical protein